MINFKNIREYENLHIVLWLLKDTCWVMLWKTGGIIMIIPTLSVALHITWLSRKSTGDLMHNLAVSFWISANSVWMIGEFFYEDSLRPAATVFFALGLISVAIYYLIILPKRKMREIKLK